MRIGVDVMGGDNAPGAILEGAIASIQKLEADDTVVLVGDADIIRKALDDSGVDQARFEIVGTTQVVEMDDKPVDAVRGKPDSSMAVLARLAGRKAENPVDAILSAGNTGAMVTAATMHLRRLPNVHRPGIAVALPTFAGPVTLIDVGANIEPRPSHLTQYGIMGAVYAQKALGIEKPRIGLMNVGAEEAKGTAHVKEARDRLRQIPDIDFVGFVEGRGVFQGEADVVITDGVVGNVMLKLSEGLAAGIFKSIAHEATKIDPELAGRLANVIKSIYARHDYHEYGGAPLLGAKTTCLICHGSSEPRTINNAVGMAKTLHECAVNDAIVGQLAAVEELVA